MQPDYQGIGVGKRLLNFIAKLYASQTKIPFYILTSNPQIIRGNMENWRITRFGHACKGKENTKMNNDIRDSLSRKRLTVSMQYIPKSYQLDLTTSIVGKEKVVRVFWRRLPRIELFWLEAPA